MFLGHFQNEYLHIFALAIHWLNILRIISLKLKYKSKFFLEWFGYSLLELSINRFWVIKKRNNLTKGNWS